MLRLLSLLQHHRFWPGDELANRLEVSERTLRRDVDRLRQLGYPVESSRGTDGGYQLAGGGSMPPLVLDNDEALALAVGLHGAAHSGVVDVAEPALRALVKVVPMMPPRLRHRVEALRETIASAPPSSAPARGVDAEVLAVVAQACRDTTRLRFSYVARDGTETERTVDPYRLVTIGRRWYLVAYDLDRDAWRTFRIDRLSQPDPSRNAYTPRPLPAEDLVAFVRSGIAEASPSIDVAVIVDADIERVQSVVGRWGTVTRADDGRCRLAITTDSLGWPLMLLAMIDAPVDVIEPPELLDRLRTVGRHWSAAARA